MEFQQNATVKAGNGDTVGRISHFVMDPRTNEITHLVVEKGFLFMEDRVIPVEAVATAEGDEVFLAPDRGGPEDFPRFEQGYYVRRDDYSTDPVLSPSMSSYYYYPPLPAAGSWGAVPVVPPVAPPGAQIGMTQPAGIMNPAGVREADSVSSQGVNNEEMLEEGVAVRKGADVYSSDGKLIGQVDEMFTAADSNRVTHIVISQGLLMKSFKLLPIHWFANMTGERLDLGTSAKVIEDLPDFQRD